MVETTARELRQDGRALPSVTADSSLDRDLGLDSLSRMELLLRVERAFGVDLPEDTLARAETVRDLLVALRKAAPPRAVASERATSVPASAMVERPGSPADAETLLDVLDWHLRDHAERVVIDYLSDERQQSITYRELAGGADAIAAGLVRAGLRPRESVALMLPTSPEYFYAFFGVLRAGGVPVPIYPPARPSQLEEHVVRHTGVLDNAQAALLITVPEAMLVGNLLRARVPNLRQVVTPLGLVPTDMATAATAVPATRPDDTAFIQYTSGSTGNPKGVMLTHANLLSNIRAMADAVQASPRDVFVSWLPLYHDLGLIGAFLGTLYVGCRLVVMSPLAFLAKPERWLWAIHRFRGTLSAAPNFAYELCLKEIDDQALEGIDLSCWRVAINGAEAVSPETVVRFVQRFRRFGLRPEAMMPAYGLAESSVALLLPPLDRGVRIDRIRRAEFSRTGRAVPAAADDPTALRFVACGRPLAGHAIRVVDDAGQELGERIDGRLEFKGPSSTPGYFRNAAETARLFHDGWVDTGDRAYLVEGEAFLTGRVKDIVIRGGRHFYPDEIEQAVSAVDGVRPTCVAVFGTPDPHSGTERLIVMAEVRDGDAAAAEKLRMAISGAVLAAIGEPADEIVLAPPDSVLKTSSGKVRRSACRAAYEEGRIGPPRGSAQVQAARLALGALALRVRLAVARAAAALYAGYATLIVCLLAPILWLLTMIAPTEARAWRLARAASRLFLRAAFVPFRVRGLEHLPQDSSCIIVCNHASYMDGMLLVGALPRAFSFVVKRELQGQLLVGPYLARLGAEFVERSEVQRSVEDANRIAEMAGRGRALIVFPEGTFIARPGLLPFFLGAFLASVRAQVPIVPVAIRGSRSLLPDGSWRLRRSSIAIEIGAPIRPPAASTDLFAAAAALRKSARSEIERLLEDVQRPGVGAAADAQR